MGEQIDMAYPEMMARFRQRRNESEVVLPLMSQMGQAIEALKTAESCLSIGPGVGEYDLEFMKRCLPNLKTIVAVERNHNCAEELKINIDKAFKGKVTCKVLEEDAETLKPTDDKFDVVLMFHVLYDIHPRLKPFFKNVLENFVKPEGLIVILNSSDDVDDQQRKVNLLPNIFLYLSDYFDPQLLADVIRTEITEAGGEVVWSQKCRCNINLKNYDDDLMAFFSLYAKKPLDSGTLKAAIQAVVPDGIGILVSEFLVAQKNCQFV